MKQKILLVIDVESVGLYGEGFAVGSAVISQNSKEILETSYFACPSDQALGDPEDRQWITENVLPYLPEPNLSLPKEVRNSFWKFREKIISYKDSEVTTWADCGFPVENNFLRMCVLDAGRDRIFSAPYPLQEIATARTLVGLDPVEPYNLPLDKKHNPVEECLYIAPKLVDWLNSSKG